MTQPLNSSCLYKNSLENLKSIYSGEDKMIWQLHEEADLWLQRASAQPCYLPSPVSNQALIQDVWHETPLSGTPDKAFLISSRSNPKLDLPTGEGVGYYRMEERFVAANHLSQVQARAGEDRGLIAMRGADTLAVILDGHAPKTAYHKGAQDIAYKNFAPYFLERLATGEEPLQAYREAVSTVQQQIVEAKKEDGSTLTACYFDEASQQLLGCHLGDSPALRYRFKPDHCVEVLRLTYLESWQDPDARARIPSDGALWLDSEGYINNGSRRLNVTRALGDSDLAPAVSQEPILWRTDFTGWDIVVLASDGLYDWFSEHEVGVIVQQWVHQPELYPHYDNLAELLVAKARKRGHMLVGMLPTQATPDSQLDDITVIVHIGDQLQVPRRRP